MIENGFEYVDLGLPSGTMWATCNVGAIKPEDSGLLFQWGRTDGYMYGDKNNQFKTHNQNKQDTGNDFIPKTTSGKLYKKNEILDLDDDAAHVNMGGKWRIPTEEQLEELYNNTTHKVETINGVKGMMLTSNINGCQLFISFAGYWNNHNDSFNYIRYVANIWSSQVYKDNKGIYVLYCSSSGLAYIGLNYRSAAFLVRGVFKPTDNKDNINMLI